MLSLLLKSIRSRIIPTSLVTISLMASMVLLLSIERIQQGTEEGFNQSISGVDAIIGRSQQKPTNIIAYSYSNSTSDQF